MTVAKKIISTLLVAAVAVGIGLVLALTVVRKRFGMLPVAFFLTTSGLGLALSLIHISEPTRPY